MIIYRLLFVVSSLNWWNVRSFIPILSRCPYISRHEKSSTLRLSSSSNDLPEFDLPDDDINESSNSPSDDQSAIMREKAEELRNQIRDMESKLGERRSNNNDLYIPLPPKLDEIEISDKKTLKNKKVLVIGANGRLGSMVTRRLLRNHPEIGEVVAAVHYVGERSSRGYGRLSYEVGAEDGVGTIGAAWAPEEERNASFMYSDEMKDYNLQKLRVIDVELLDPAQCKLIVESIDSVVFCATDFNNNAPRSVSSLNLAFLYRAVASPDKGRVEIEGLTNILGALKQSKLNRKKVAMLTNEESSSSALQGPNDPISVVLVSVSPNIFGEYETPFGEFNAIKREGEKILSDNFPSLSYTILQMGMYEDNFVGESLDILFEKVTKKDTDGTENKEKRRRKINRRDAARAVSDALLDDELEGKTVEVWTALRG